jgi:hypothetical protein
MPAPPWGRGWRAAPGEGVDPSLYYVTLSRTLLGVIAGAAREVRKAGGHKSRPYESEGEALALRGRICYRNVVVDQFTGR